MASAVAPSYPIHFPSDPLAPFIRTVPQRVFYRVNNARQRRSLYNPPAHTDSECTSGLLLRPQDSLGTQPITFRKQQQETSVRSSSVPNISTIADRTDDTNRSFSSSVLHDDLIGQNGSVDGPAIDLKVMRQSFRSRLAAVVNEAQNLQKERNALDKDLLAASAKGRIVAVNRLLAETWANPNCVTRHGMTPLHYAARAGIDDVVERLLAAGADPLKTDSKGRTPLDLALENKNIEIVQILQNHIIGRPSSSGEDSKNQKLQLIGFGESGIVKNETKMQGNFFINVAVETGRVQGPLYAPYTMYTITVTAHSPTLGRRQFIVTRRFRHFLRFHQVLMQKCCSPDFQKKLAALEPQKTFFSRFSQRVISSRAKLFEKLLLLAVSGPAQLQLVFEFLTSEEME